MMDTNTEPTTAPVAGPPSLRRPRAGRVFAGVAAGLAERADVPAWVVRLVFVMLAFAGGAGFALYLIGWLFIANEGEEESIAVRTFSRTDGTTSWIGVALIAIAILIAIDSIGFVRGDFALALVLLVVGVLLYRGDLRGVFPPSARSDTSPADDGPADKETTMSTSTPPPAGATALVGAEGPTGDTSTATAQSRPSMPPSPPRRPKHPPSYLGRLTVGLGLVTLGGMALADYLMTTFDPQARHYFGTALAFIAAGLIVGTWFGRARGLIVLGVILVPPLLVSPFAEFDFDGPVGEQRFEPTSIAEIEDSYELAFGELIIDLRNVDFEGQDIFGFDARVGIGSLQIIVPEGVGIEGEARVGIGEVDVPSADRGGFARLVDIDMAGSGTIVIDARTNIGQVVVRTASPGESVPDTDLGFGDVDLTITDVDDLDADYSVDAGNLVIDLSAIDLSLVELPRTVTIDVGTGAVNVIVDDADLIDVTAEVGIGQIDLFGQKSDGLGVERDFDGPLEASLTFDIGVGAGTVTVEEN